MVDPLTSAALSLALRGGRAAARQMLQLEDRRIKQLKHITAVAEANLAGPYKAGLEHLKIAAKAETDQNASRQLGLAEERFVEAFGNFQDIDLLQTAWAAVNLTIICIATERKNEALHWAQHAHGYAVRAADLVSQQLRDQADGRRGYLRLTSENTEAAVLLGTSAATGMGAAAAGITIASGGAAWIPVGIAVGSAYIVTKGMSMYRNHKLKVGADGVEEMSTFVNDTMNLRERLEDREIQ